MKSQLSYPLFIIVLLFFQNTYGQIQINSDIIGKAKYDYFGHSVCLSSNGNIVAIGAANNDSGYVQVFNNNGNEWIQIGENINGEADGDYSGCSVSLNSDGNIVAIGAMLNNGNGEGSGHVRVFENSSNVWSQIGNDIDGEATKDHSGYSLCLNSDGNVIAIGAIQNNGDVMNSMKGHVRVYKNISGTWTQIGSDIDGVTAGDKFGHSVGLNSDGTIVAVGAISNDENGQSSGQVRIFENISNVWTQIGSPINGENAGDQSGFSVSINSDGTIVAIGANYNNGNGAYSGHARIFKNISGVWTQIGNDIDSEAAGDRSGSSISLNSEGTMVAIGAAGNNTLGSNTGQARVFKYLLGEWQQLGIDMDGLEMYSQFGFSVNMNATGDIVAVSGVSGYDKKGYVRVYEFNTYSAISESVCNVYNSPSGEYSWTKSGIYYDTIPNTLGFDSVITISLTVNNSNLGSQSVIACDSFNWDATGINYTTSGTYTAILTNIWGCDSATNLHLTVNNRNSDTLSITDCGSYMWPLNRTTYTKTGIYSDTLMNLSGCDSIIYLELILNNNSGYEYRTVCDSFFWSANGETYKSSGIFETILENSLGCDSVVTLYLSVNKSVLTTTEITACDSFFWENTGVIYNISGIYTDTMATSTGCDSIIILDLKIIPGNSTTEKILACNSYTWELNGITYYNSGTYFDTLKNCLGCDSIVSLNLTISESNAAFEEITACGKYTWPITGITYSNSGNYVDTLVNFLGCDSIVTLKLNLIKIDNSITKNEKTLSVTPGYDYQWISCNNNYTPVENNNEEIFIAKSNGSYAVIINKGGCVDTSACINLEDIVSVYEYVNNPGISIFPNPVKESLTIVGENIQEISIINMKGQIVERTEGNITQINLDISGYQKGLYLIKIITTREIIFRKVLFE